MSRQYYDSAKAMEAAEAQRAAEFKDDPTAIGIFYRGAEAVNAFRKYFDDELLAFTGNDAMELVEGMAIVLAAMNAHFIINLAHNAMLKSPQEISDFIEKLLVGVVDNTLLTLRVAEIHQMPQPGGRHD